MENQSEESGIIFKIKRFSVHDGPGIRTSVFLKGCPLNCIWCHSPEGIGQDISIWYNSNLCIACGMCVKACPENALQLSAGDRPSVTINRQKCKLSGDCVNICPSKALEFTGFKATAAEILEEVLKDQAFYTESGGGMTITGGEPLYQPEFSAEILRLCKNQGIHTAIETSLFCEKSVIDRVSQFIDLFIVDMKLSDPFQHTFYTGRSNVIIKENLQYLSEKGKTIIVRIPLIDNITNTPENIDAITDFVKKTDKNILIEKISYNPLAGNNYKKLGMPFLLNISNHDL